MVGAPDAGLLAGGSGSAGGSSAWSSSSSATFFSSHRRPPLFLPGSDVQSLAVGSPRKNLGMTEPVSPVSRFTWSWVASVTSE